jgi:membrane protein implicated in regulation of membrane protease activity
MTLETFYLVCFVVGFTFSAFSFLGGFTHGHFHLPKGLHLGGHAHGAPVGGHTGPVGGAHGAHLPHAGGHAPHSVQTAHAPQGGRAPKVGSHFPIINPMTMAAFLTWFGGAGYLTEHHHWSLLTGMSVASLAGVSGASAVFWFVGKVLMGHDYTMDPSDYEMVGVLGRISSGVRESGTGEMIYEQMGVRRVCAARSEINERLEKGVEVVVTHYERGVAYVRRWEDLANEPGALPEKDQEIRS